MRMKMNKKGIMKEEKCGRVPRCLFSCINEYMKTLKGEGTSLSQVTFRDGHFS